MKANAGIAYVLVHQWKILKIYSLMQNLLTFPVICFQLLLIVHTKPEYFSQTFTWFLKVVLTLISWSNKPCFTSEINNLGIVSDDKIRKLTAFLCSIDLTSENNMLHCNNNNNTLSWIQVLSFRYYKKDANERK